MSGQSAEGRGTLILAVGLFVVGSAVMLFLDSGLARIVGVAALLGAIAAGVFAIASPGYLAEVPEAERED